VTAAAPSSAPAPAAPGVIAAGDQPKRKGAGFCFTDPGCRTDIRFGALLILAAVFLWLFMGPTFCSRLYLVGAPFLLWGVPMQALQARRQGRPGFPWKLGLAMAIGGAVMWPELRYREIVGGGVSVQPVAPLLLIAGAWIVAWWPVARTGAATKSSPTVAGAHA
jgi:hypothetical protein